MSQEFTARQVFRAVFFAALLFTGCIVPSSAFSATIFVGIGNDGYYQDVQGMLQAVSSLSFDGPLTAYTYENRTAPQIKSDIADLKAVFHSDDTLIWYYSGHAGHVSDTDGDEPVVSSDHKNFDEAIGLKYHGGWLSDDELSLAFSDLMVEGGNIITIFDTCFAGGFVGGEKDLNSVDGLTFLASSGETEDSYSVHGQPYSVFTQGLINAVYAASDHFDGSGAVTADSLFEYAMSHIHVDLPDNKSQTPFYWDESIPLDPALPVPLPATVLLLAAGLGLLKLRFAVFIH